MKMRFSKPISLALCLTLLLGSLAWPAPARAQGGGSDGHGNYWRHYNTSDSDLPSNNIRAVAYTEDVNVDVAIPGLWIGTDEGLSYTNGRDWVHYTVVNSDIPTNTVQAVISGQEAGELWIATVSGVARLDYGGTPRDRNDDIWQVFTPADGLPAADALSLTLGREGELWVGTTGGVARYDGATWYVYTDGLPAPEIRDLAYDAGRGGLWVATGSGVGRFDLEDPEPPAIYRATGARDQFSGNQLPDDDVRALAVSPDGRVWMGTVNGLAALRQAQDEAPSPDDIWQIWVASEPGLPHQSATELYPITDLSLDPSGRYLWIATDGGGASRYDTQTDHWTRLNTLGSDLPSDHVQVVVPSHANTAWLGMPAGLSGVERPWETHNFYAPRVPGGLPCSRVQAGWVDPEMDTVWVGTTTISGEGCGVSRSDDNGTTWQNFSTAEGLGNNPVYTVWGDGAGTVWVGTGGGGVSRSDDGGATWQTFTTAEGLGSDWVRAVWGDSRGVVWVGTSGGVSRSDDNGITWQNFSTAEGLRSNNVLAVWGDGADTVWVGTWGGGVSRSDDGGTTWQNFTTAEGLGSDWVRAVWGDGAGTVWVGAWGGMSRSDDNGADWQIFTTAEGLGSNDVEAVWGDGAGTVWVGTPVGVSRSSDGGTSWQTFTAANGLGADYVDAVWGNSVGTVWVGTWGGVSRSNDGGASRQTFTTIESPGDDSIWAVWADGGGVVWVGTYGSGVSRSDDGGATWQTFTTAEGLGANNVRSVWRDNRGVVWIGTWGGGVSRSDDGGATWRTFTTAEGLGANYVRSVWGDGAGTVWVGTSGGVSRSDDDGASWQTFTTAEGLGSNYVDALWGDGTGTVWVGTSGGLSRSDDNGASWQTFGMADGLGSDPVRSVWGNGAGTVWVGTESGMGRSDDGGTSWQTFGMADGLGSDYVRSVWVDDAGAVWAGTDGGGVSRSEDDGANWRTFTKADGLGSNFARSMWVDEAGVIWIGTDGGVSRSDDEGASWRNFTITGGLGSNYVSLVWGDGTGTVWVGLYGGGVSRSDDKGSTWQTFTTADGLRANYVSSVWIDGVGTVWVGTDGWGVSQSDDGGATWQTFTTAEGLGADYVRSVWGDGAGTVWVGTSGGVSRSDDDGVTWQTFTTTHGLRSDDVSSVWGDKTGTVWVGTLGGGVSRSDDDGATWQTFTTAQGLGSDWVRAVWGDSRGVVWVGTSGGVSRSDDNGITWQNFSTAEGLRSNNVLAVWGDRAGTVWVGTRGGGVCWSDDGGTTWQTLTAEQDLGSSDVNSVWGDGAGTVWVGTSGGLRCLASAAGLAPVAGWLAPDELAAGAPLRMLDARILEAQFAGLNLAPVGGLEYTVLLSSVDQDRTFSETVSAAEIGEAGIAQVSLPGEAGDDEQATLLFGDYGLSLTATDLFGRSSSTHRTVEVQARPLLAQGALGQEGTYRTITLTSSSGSELTPSKIAFTITDLDSSPASVAISYTWAPGTESNWRPLDADVIGASELVVGSHILALRATDPDGNSSLESLTFPVQVDVPSSSNLTWLLVGALAILAAVGAAGVSLRRYPAYAGQWSAAKDYPLQQIIPLVAPSSQPVDGKGLEPALRALQAFSTPEQVRDALDGLVERGLMWREGDKYRFVSSWTARVHRWMQGRRAVDLAERVRTQHPLYARTRGFFTQARFRLQELGAEEFLLVPQGQTHPQAGYGPVYARLIAGRASTGEDFTAVCGAARDQYSDDLPHRVALVISDRRPEPGARYRLYEIRQREGLAIVPLDVSLFGQIKPNRTANDILASEIDQATGQQNLYGISGPVSSDLSFFGRERVLQEIVDLLNVGQPVGVFGLRKVGKTSLIQRLQGRLAQQRPIALVDTQKTAQQRGIWLLYPDIIAAFATHLQRYHSEVALPELRLWPGSHAPSPAMADAFVQDVQTLHIALGEPNKNERLLLIVDEIERLLPTDDAPGYEGFATFFGQLRAANQHARMLDFLVVGVDATVNRIERWVDRGVDNELYRALREVWMLPMALGDVREMIESLGSQIGVRYEWKALDLLARSGGGQPFVTRQICSRAVEGQLHRGAITVTVDQAHVAIGEFISRDPYLPELWRTRLDATQREMLRALARSSEPLSRAQLLPAAQRQGPLASLSELEEYTLVRTDEGGYVVAWDVLRKWIRWVELGLEE